MNKTIKEYKEDIVLLRKALDAAILALDDWTNSYYPLQHCLIKQLIDLQK